MEMDDFAINQLPEQRLVVFVASTTGQGEEPDNMKKSWRCIISNIYCKQTAMVRNLTGLFYLQFY